LNTHIIFESVLVLVLFTKNYQNYSMLVETSAWQSWCIFWDTVSNFVDVQCRALPLSLTALPVIVAITANSCCYDFLVDCMKQSVPPVEFTTLKVSCVRCVQRKQRSNMVKARWKFILQALFLCTMPLRRERQKHIWKWFAFCQRKRYAF